MGNVDARQIEDEWKAALEDAGPFKRAGCRLFVTSDVPGQEGVGAQWCEPGIPMNPGRLLVTEQLAAKVNSPGFHQSEAN
jgi:hypothetical protein